MSEFGLEGEQTTPAAESREKPNEPSLPEEPAAASAGQESQSETATAAPPAEDGEGEVEGKLEGGEATKKEKGATVRVVEVAAGQEEQKRCCVQNHDSEAGEGEGHGHDHDHEVCRIPRASICVLLLTLVGWCWLSPLYLPLLLKSHKAPAVGSRSHFVLLG